MDIFGDDIDTLLQTEDNNELNENIRGEDIEEENEDDEKKADSESVKVEPKKRAVRNPQVSYNFRVFCFQNLFRVNFDFVNN